MPSTEQLLVAFGLNRGARVDGYYITGVFGDEISVRRYHEYKYNIKIEFAAVGYSTPEALIPALWAMISQPRDVFATRNYYNCSFDPISQANVTMEAAGNLSVTLTAHGYR